MKQTDQPSAMRERFAIGQVVWHEGYKHYMRIHSIVPAWNTPGTIQVHADKMRPLTLEEFGQAAQIPNKKIEEMARRVQDKIQQVTMPTTKEIAEILRQAMEGK